MSDPIKHHIVPQCYLRRFSVDKISVKYFDKSLNELKEEEIDNICYINDFYTLTQSYPYFIETTFFANNIEDKLARILTHFENIDFNLSTVNYDKTLRHNLAKQIVLQYMRTPIYRDARSLYELNLHYDRIKNILRKIDFEVENIEFIPSNKAEYHKTILLENINDVISIIEKANWELIYTSSKEFYTSDNPITIKTNGNDYIEYYDAIKKFEEIFYPLNSHLLLHISNHQSMSFKTISIRNTNDLEIDNINTLIKNNAVQYVIYKDIFK